MLCWEPIRYEINEPQAATVINFVVCIFFSCGVISRQIGRNEHSKNNSWCLWFYYSYGKISIILPAIS